MKNELYSLHKGSIVPSDLICHLKDNLQIVTESKHYLQLGGAVDYSFTLDGHLEPLYMTFSVFKGTLRYMGLCFKNETIDQSWR